MNSASKKAILVVSFGTSYENTRKVTIDAIERDIADAFPACPTYRAWTSKMIISKLKKRDGIIINTVKEAMEQMLRDGITDVVVQPTHVINGIENDQMKADALSFKDQFASIVFGNPLLTTENDNQAVVKAVADEFQDMDSMTALVLMGHGTEHVANELYPEMDGLFKHFGYSNMHMGTVEGDFSIESFLDELKELHPAHIHLAPFMIVAGDHATNDMSGEDDDSWKSILEREGYSVTCTLKGLGEIQAIRDIFIRHTKMGLDKLS